MNLVTEVLTLKNASFPHFTVLKTQAFIDEECSSLCIPESVREELDLDPVGMRPAVLADGTEKLVPYVGPIELRLRDAVTFCGALVMGDQVLIGRIPMVGLTA